jgi:hypothetical protein
MSIATYIGDTIDEPIRNGVMLNYKTMWDAPVKLGVKGQSRIITSKPPLAYTLLRYIPGLVTYCSLGSAPVWTGYMTGCFLFRFRMNGKSHAAHIGTDINSQENTDKVKAVWTAFANRPDVTDVMGYSPASEVPTTTLVALQRSGKAAGITGFWESNGAMRIVMMAGIHGQETKKMIFSVDAAPLQPWSVLRNHPKFRPAV